MNFSVIAKLTLIVFAGGAVIFGILWLLTVFTPLHGKDVLPLFIPLGLFWVGGCIVYVLRAPKTDHPKPDQGKG